jgi:hypothetical protein
MTPPPVTSDYIARTNFSTLHIFDEYFNGTDNVSGVATINYDLQNSLLTIFANGSTMDNNTLIVEGGVEAEDFCTSGSCLSALQASYTEGSILFSNGTSITEDNNNLYWDDDNDRLGFKTTNPEKTIDVKGDEGIRAGGLDIDFVGAPSSVSAELVPGTELGVGTYHYAIVYATVLGETSITRIPGNTITTTPGNQNVKLTLPTSNDIRVVNVTIYRSEVNETVYGLRHVDSVPVGTTEYIDDTPDASLQPASGVFYQADTTSRGITFNNETAVNIGGYTFVGSKAGYEISRNNNNEVFIGQNAGRKASVSYGMTAVGTAAGYNSKGQFSTYMGMSAGVSDTGSRNTIIGYYAGYGTSGFSNTIIGNNAGVQNSNSYNTMVGKSAGYQNTGRDSTFVGSYSGDGNDGHRVTGLGRSALQDNTGDDVVAIGFQAGNSNTDSDQFIVQQANVNSVPLIQGDFATGHLGVGTTSPSYRLDIEANSNTTGVRVRNIKSLGDSYFILDADVNTKYFFREDGNNRFNLGYDAAQNDFEVYNYRLHENALKISENNGDVVVARDFGVGVEEPESNLHVQGNDTSVSAIIKNTKALGNAYNILDSNGYNAKHIFRDDGNNRWSIGMNEVEDVFEIYNYEIGDRNMVIEDTTGNVGIRTTTPESILNINGGTGSLSTGLSFGDGDSGIYESSDDEMVIKANSLNVDSNISTNNLTVDESATIAELIICDNGTSTILTRNRSIAISKGCDV